MIQILNAEFNRRASSVGENSLGGFLRVEGPELVLRLVDDWLKLERVRRDHGQIRTSFAM